MSITHLFKRIDTTKLYPPFFRLATRALEAAAHAGEEYVVTSGVRSIEEQDALYAKGRTLPPIGKVVTQKAGGGSCHNYGIALDGCRDADVNKPGLQPDYTKAHYDVLGISAEGAGLEWGGRWEGLIDCPHIQLPLRKHGLSTSVLLRVYRRGGKHGMKAVWAQLDLVDWE